ncbi:Leucine-rich repeat, cysteine-containing subtype [Artemisia annua]|uniref:Leucine-rich repeat, cysteine-containing subtype n=1 Tax=Artemisia annua TaxID=35608 RepID=A0A2U1PDF1_ARTAN|nr:Leucine-rich repeat, cysteine-containing subtype [Artemisia annua]
MTVLRSRKVVVVSPNEQQQQHSPNNNINNTKSSLAVVNEIEPLTPNKQQIEAMDNNETTPASSSHKLGLVASTDSGRVLRRSARLSLNSSSYDVVDNVGGSTRKRKAVVKVESKEESGDVDGSGLNGMDGVDKESGVKVSMEVDTGVLVSDMGADQSDKKETESVRDDKEAGVHEGDVGSKSLNLRSGKKVVLIPDLNQVAADDEKLSPASDGSVRIELKGGSSVDVNGCTTRWRRFSREDKNKGVAVVDVEEDMDVGIGNATLEGERSRIDIGDKGKGKVIEIVSLSSDSGQDNMNEEFVVGNSSSRYHYPVDTDTEEEPDVGLMGGTIAADAGSLGRAAFERANTSSRMRERFKDLAKKNATRFAYFSHQEEEEDLEVDDDDEPELPQTEANADAEDWPGPFSTAMKIINDRAANMPPQKKRKAESVPLVWVPKKKQRVMRAAPSLQDLCMTIMSQHVDAITSLESVPDAHRHKLTRLLCDSRKMNHHFFDLLASGTPTEIRVRDCSWLTEEQFTKTFEKTDVSNLTVLQLDQCGRCLPDFVLLPILGNLPSQLSALTNISLKGACRLSDAGLKALVAAAPALRSVNLGCCSLLTVDAINNLADKLGPVLKELYIDECFDLDAKRILPALLKLEQLEVLSVAHNESVNNSFIKKFVAARGHNMKELVLANCTKLTDKALRAISKSCPGLCAIDLTNVSKLTDKSLAHLANGCQNIQILKFCRNMFSDEAVAAYLEAYGARLRELSLNHVNKVAHHTAISLAKHARNLETLDLSFCREMTNEALGLIADSCLSLKTLKLFGCTQITNVFTEGHSNEGVKIIGLVESQILKNIEAVELLPLRYSAA